MEYYNRWDSNMWARNISHVRKLNHRLYKNYGWGIIYIKELIKIRGKGL